MSIQSDIYDFIVVGAGLAGVSVAWHLARAGKHVLLVDKGIPGANGATAATGAICRGYDPEIRLQPLNRLGNYLLSNWEKLAYPGPSPFTKRGFVWRHRSDKISHRALDNWQCLCDQTGFRLEILTNSIASYRFDWLAQTEQNSLILYEPDNGTLNARQFVYQLIADIQKQSGYILTSTSINAIEPCDHGWKLATQLGHLKTRQVVICGGYDSLSLWADLPLTSQNITVTACQNTNENRSPQAFIDDISGTYFCPIGQNQMLVGMKDSLKDTHEAVELLPAQNVQDVRQYCRNFLFKSFKHADEWVPHAIRQASDAYTPDHLPILGQLADRQGNLIPGLHTFSGCSGLGAKFALAGGLILAKYLSDDKNRLFELPESLLETLPALNLFSIKRFLKEPSIRSMAIV